MKPANLIFAIVLGSAVAAGIFVATKTIRPAEPRSALIIPVPGELPDFSLLDQSGKRVDASTFRGQWDLVFFGFTNCPDICPTTMQMLATARQELARSYAGSLPRIVLVSVDPERDTPALLGQYVDHFGKGNLAVTGDLEELRKLTTALGIYFEKSPVEDGHYSVNHSAAVLVLDTNGEFSALFSAPHSVADYVHDLPIIMERHVLAPLIATDIVISAPLPGSKISAGYLSLANNTEQAISITSISSADFAAVEIHESLLENGVAKMRRVDKLVIPAYSSIALQRGGQHLMLTQPNGTPNTVSLNFYSGDTMLLSVQTNIARENN